MKRFSIVFFSIMLLIGFVDLSAQPLQPNPTPSWNYSTASASYGTIILKPVANGGVYTINGRAMASGDAIGVFFMDGTVRKCAGYIVWVGANNAGNDMLPAWEDDAITTTIKEGFAPGETLSYMMWDSLMQMEVPVISMVCNTDGIPSLGVPPMGACATTFSADMVFMYDSMVGQILGVPTLTTPADLVTDVALSPTFTWQSVATATGYKVQVSTDNTFATTIKDETVTGTTTSATGLTGSTMYYWRVKALRGAEEGTWSAANSFTTMTVATGYSLTGTVKYAKTTPVAMNNMTIVLKNSSNAVVGTAVTDATGNYAFANLPNGAYTMTITTLKVPGGHTTVDALRIRQHLGGIATSVTPFNALRLKAADIAVGTLNTSDALQLRRKLGLLTFNWTAPAFVYLPVTVTIDNANATLDVLSLSSGDVDGSFTPSGN